LYIYGDDEAEQELEAVFSAVSKLQELNNLSLFLSQMPIGTYAQSLSTCLSQLQNLSQLYLCIDTRIVGDYENDGFIENSKEPLD